ncbi:MAG: hypothetical protein CBD97_00990 [Pelagibacteraceae bacterium TMED237]|nr:hypothetical protein [Candidatus Neomarinimicrobiota bacterium]OUW96641.1 MAG: hypothetical protein CBD97_00990 [Pelagibacteraceae bacterium TMED237]|tara:strand:- start:4636 stop:5643 length:1008 start_codon:yes stop_codon:yes gene_type:complete
MNRYILFVAILFLQFCSTSKQTKNEQYEIYSILENLSDSISEKLISNSIEKIAFMNYQDLSKTNQALSKYILNEITLQLFLKEKFQIIEREQIEYIVNEQKLNSSGLINPESAIEIGNILSVDAIILGSISEFKNEIIINTKVISSNTGEVLFLNKTSFLKDNKYNFILDNQNDINKNRKSFRKKDSNQADRSQLIRRLGRSFLSCLKKNDYECYSEYRANKSQFRNILLMVHVHNKSKRESMLENLNIEYKKYKKTHKRKFVKLINQLNSRGVDWSRVEVEKIDFKVIKDFDQKKLFKVDLILKQGIKHIHIGFKTFWLNGEFIIYNLDMKRNK